MYCIKCGNLTNEENLCENCRNENIANTLIRSLWKRSAIIYGIIILIAFILPYKFIQDVWSAIFYMVFILCVGSLSILIYVLIKISQIVNKYYSRKIYGKLILISFLLFIIFNFVSIIFIPFIPLISFEICRKYYNKNNIETKNKSSLSKNILIYTIIILITIIVFLFNYNSIIKKLTPSKCVDYISSNDKFVYCKTDINTIKRINLKNNKQKQYGFDIEYYTNLNNNDYILYADTKLIGPIFNRSLYILNINSGKKKYIKNVGSAQLTFNFENDNIYIEKFEYNYKYYIYNIKSKKLKKINADYLDVESINDNKSYFCDNDKISIYDIKSSNVIKTNNNCNNILSKNVGDKSISDNGYKYLLRDGELFIYNYNDNTIKRVNVDNCYNFYKNNNKIYLFTKDKSTNNTIVLYYDILTGKIYNTNLKYERTSDKVIIDKDILYYVEKNKLYEYNFNTKTNNFLLSHISSLEGLSNNYIYYIDKSNNFEVLNLDDISKEKISFNNYVYKIKYIFGSEEYYIYLFKDKNIKVVRKTPIFETCPDTECIKLTGEYQYTKIDIKFSSKAKKEVIKVFDELYKQNNSKDMDTNNYILTEYQEKIIIAVIIDSEEYIYNSSFDEL